MCVLELQAEVFFDEELVGLVSTESHRTIKLLVLLSLQLTIEVIYSFKFTESGVT